MPYPDKSRKPAYSLPGRNDPDLIRGRRDPDDRRDKPDTVPDGTVYRSLESLKTDPPRPGFPTEGGLS